MDSTPLLETIQGPGDVHRLTNAELERLAGELRRRIIAVCSENGGHLAPSLGTVELTLALLAEFDLDRDKLVWDVGHQTYAYKILTGRNREFGTLRRRGGLAGFPRLAESPYDFFGVGHSSTSISASLGMATARDLEGKDHSVVAVIGDGSMTAGEAFEGLNLAGHLRKKLIVVLNDNEMSIAPNVGALSRFLSRNLSRRWFRQTRKDVLSFLRTIPRIGDNLATYAAQGNAEATCTILHRLKGQLAAIGLLDHSEQTVTMMEAFRSGNTAKGQAMVVALNQSLTRIFKSLESDVTIPQ